MSKKLQYCDRCGRAYRPDRFNRHRQKYCKNPDCVLERKRERQRKSYRKRYADDKEFRRKERRRCAESIRKRRFHPEALCSGSFIYSDSLPDALAGLVSHLSDSCNPDFVLRRLFDYADRGRRLSLSGKVGVFSDE